MYLQVSLAPKGGLLRPFWGAEVEIDLKNAIFLTFIKRPKNDLMVFIKSIFLKTNSKWASHDLFQIIMTIPTKAIQILKYVVKK